MALIWPETHNTSEVAFLAMTKKQTNEFFSLFLGSPCRETPKNAIKKFVKKTYKQKAPPSSQDCQALVLISSRLQLQPAAPKKNGLSPAGSSTSLCSPDRVAGFRTPLSGRDPDLDGPWVRWTSSGDWSTLARRRPPAGMNDACAQGGVPVEWRGPRGSPQSGTRRAGLRSYPLERHSFSRRRRSWLPPEAHLAPYGQLLPAADALQAGHDLASHN